MSDLRPMELSDLQLASCTRWIAPDGVVYLEIPYTLPYYKTVAAGAQLDDDELGTHPRYEFAVKLIGNAGITPGTIVQVQWPDARYLSNPGIDVFSFWGTGRRGRLMHPPKRLRPASKIRFNVDNSSVAVQSDIEIFFEGVLRIPLVKR